MHVKIPIEDDDNPDDHDDHDDLVIKHYLAIVWYLVVMKYYTNDEISLSEKMLSRGERHFVINSHEVKKCKM